MERQGLNIWKMNMSWYFDLDGWKFDPPGAQLYFLCVYVQSIYLLHPYLETILALLDIWKYLTNCIEKGD